MDRVHVPTVGDVRVTCQDVPINAPGIGIIGALAALRPSLPMDPR